MNMNLDRIAFDLFTPTVKALFNLRPRQNVSGPLHQQLQECELLGRHSDLASFTGDRMGRGIQSNTQVLNLGLRAPGLAPQERTDTRRELIEIEWLDQVVVCAGVETLHAIRYRITGRNDEHREGLLTRSQTLQHLEATLSGESKIEKQEIERISAEHLVRSLAVVDPIDSEAVPLQAGSDRLGDHGIIFD
jgi:hypothetical protein